MADIDRTDPSAPLHEGQTRDALLDADRTQPIHGTVRSEPVRATMRTETLGNVSERADPRVRETARLIASDKVEGTSVRNSAGDKVGTIERVMIDKRSGKVAYAVMTFGGFLGMGQDYSTLPWHVLRYSEDLDAYELNITPEQLKGAPRFSGEWDTGTVNREWERNVHNYYGVDPYW